MNYQYTNFGVPTLGLKRGLGQNAVVAPYASILASQYYPEAALENLKRLRKLGALGAYGFYDAVDFTPTRLPDGKKCAVVYNYYAHHHGMSIAAIANVAFNGVCAPSSMPIRWSKRLNFSCRKRHRAKSR